jgi:hypothetical protein
LNSAASGRFELAISSAFIDAAMHRLSILPGLLFCTAIFASARAGPTSQCVK